MWRLFCRYSLFDPHLSFFFASAKLCCVIVTFPEYIYICLDTILSFRHSARQSDPSKHSL